MELIGPKINGNPEGSPDHLLIKHGVDLVDNLSRGFYELREIFLMGNIEGIVWHHSDGRMVKIKAKDFGIKRCKIQID